VLSQNNCGKATIGFVMSVCIKQLGPQ